ncbi:MAG: NAD(P)-dependent oxidoreductase [Propionibacterium sp.]|nr:NAD(P)-dependent oxidoreductase [Propionibacterium sp.]
MLLTGAGGQVGRRLRRHLPGYGWRLRLLDQRPIPDAETDDCLVGSVLDDDTLRAAVSGVRAIVHLAAIPGEAPWPDLLSNNLDATFRVFETARRAGVARVVFASTNHVIGFSDRDRMTGPDDPVRPDSFYAATKAFGEALARFYADEYGMEMACIRLGSCVERPTIVGHLATWLSARDEAALVHACLSAPDLQFATVFGISDNTRARWDLESARRLGYRPRDNAEEYAEELLEAARHDDRAARASGFREARKELGLGPVPRGPAQGDIGAPGCRS